MRCARFPAPAFPPYICTMLVPTPYKLMQQQLWLSADRCIFWEEEKTLIVSDLHFGKTGHFRKYGIAVPQSVYKNDLQRLVHQLQYFQPKKLIVVGDLFHSSENKELQLFCKWRNDFPSLEIHLVKGNHDILHEDWYREAGICVWDEELSVPPFHFRHDLGEAAPISGRYLFSGHIHPGVRIKGMGKQSLCLPCFYFAQNFCVLPAFSEFTGTARIDPENGDAVFAIVEKKLVQLQ
jgi:DNA ligase-associated metallophosphoesterase